MVLCVQISSSANQDLHIERMSPSDMWWIGSRYATICIVPDFGDAGGPVVDVDEIQQEAMEEMELPTLEMFDMDEDSLPELEYDPLPTGYVRETDTEDESDDDGNYSMDMDRMVDMLCDEDFTFQ